MLVLQGSFFLKKKKKRMKKSFQKKRFSTHRDTHTHIHSTFVLFSKSEPDRIQDKEGVGPRG